MLLTEIAYRYRSEQDKVYQSGFVIVFNEEALCWSPVMPAAKDFGAGAIAVSETEDLWRTTENNQWEKMNRQPLSDSRLTDLVAGVLDISGDLDSKRQLALLARIIEQAHNIGTDRKNLDLTAPDYLPAVLPDIAFTNPGNEAVFLVAKSLLASNPKVLLNESS